MASRGGPGTAVRAKRFTTSLAIPGGQVPQAPLYTPSTTRELKADDPMWEAVQEALDGFVGAEDVRNLLSNYIAARSRKAEADMKEYRAALEIERDAWERFAQQLQAQMGALRSYLPNLESYWDQAPNIAGLPSADSRPPTAPMPPVTPRTAGSNSRKGKRTKKEKKDGKSLQLPPLPGARSHDSGDEGGVPITMTGSMTAWEGQHSTRSKASSGARTATSSQQGPRPWNAGAPRPPPTAPAHRSERPNTMMSGMAATVGRPTTTFKGIPVAPQARGGRNLQSRGGRSRVRALKIKTAAMDTIDAISTCRQKSSDLLLPANPDRFTPEQREKLKADVATLMMTLGVGITQEEADSRMLGLQQELKASEAKLTDARDQLKKAHANVEQLSETVSKERSRAAVAEASLSELRQSLADTRKQLHAAELAAQLVTEQKPVRVTYSETYEIGAKPPAEEPVLEPLTEEGEEEAAELGADDEGGEDFEEKLKSATLIVALGEADSGVSDAADSLADTYGLTVLHAQELMMAEMSAGSPEGLQCIELLQQGKLVTGETMLQIVHKAALASGSRTNKFLLEGFPKSVEAAESLAELVEPDCFLAYGELSGAEAAVAAAYEEKGVAAKVSSEQEAMDALDAAGLERDGGKLEDCTLVVALGGPDSGVGVHCDKLAGDYGLTLLHAGDLLTAEITKGSPEGLHCLSLLQRGQLVPGDVILGLVKKAMLDSDSDSFLLEGFPKSTEQAELLDAVVAPKHALAFVDEGLGENEAAVVEAYEAKGKGTKLTVDEDFEAAYALASSALEGAGLPKSARRLQDMTLVLAIGGPESGVSHYAEKLAGEFDLVTLHATDIMQQEINAQSSVGQECLALLMSGKMVPAKTTWEMVQGAMLKSGSAKGFVLEAFPRSVEQAELLEEVMAPDAVLCFVDGSLADGDAAVSEHYQSKDACTRIDVSGEEEEVFGAASAAVAEAGLAKSARRLQDCTLVLAIGGADSGVSRHAEKLSGDYDLVSFQAGDLVLSEIEAGSEEGQQCKALLSQGRLVPPELQLELIKKALVSSEGTKFILEGFPRNTEQAEMLENLMAPDAVLCFMDGSLQECDAQVAEHYAEKVVRIEAEGEEEEVYASAAKALDEAGLDKSARRLQDCTLVLSLNGADHESAVAEAFDLMKIDAAEIVLAEIEAGTEDGLRCKALLSQGKIVSSELQLELMKKVMVDSGKDKFLMCSGFPKAGEEAELLASVMQPDAVLAFGDLGADVSEVKARFADAATSVQSSADAEAALDAAGVSRSTRWLADCTLLLAVGEAAGDQCEGLASALGGGARALRLEDLVAAAVEARTAEGVQCEALLSQGKILSAEVLVGVVVGAMGTARAAGAGAFVLEGFPRSEEQAEVLHAVVQAKAVVSFEPPDLPADAAGVLKWYEAKGAAVVRAPDAAGAEEGAKQAAGLAA